MQLRHCITFRTNFSRENEVEPSKRKGKRKRKKRGGGKGKGRVGIASFILLLRGRSEGRSKGRKKGRKSRELTWAFKLLLSLFPSNREKEKEEKGRERREGKRGRERSGRFLPRPSPCTPLGKKKERGGTVKMKYVRRIEKKRKKKGKGKGGTISVSITCRF